MDLRKYIAESVRHYNYRIKTVVPLDDKAMDKIERALAKYDPQDISRVRKTMLQKQPLDFIDVESAEVYIVDVVLGLPASSYVLQQEIRNAINCVEKFVVVRGDNEPIEVEGEKIAAERDMDAEARKKAYKRASLLSVDADYLKVEQGEPGSKFYGNDYNSAFLDKLRQVQDERRETKVNSADPLFNWLDMPKESQEPVQDAADFNAHLSDAPKTKKRKAKGYVDPTKDISIQGNFDNDSAEYHRSYVDAKGNEKILSRKVTGMRGGK